MTEILDWKAMKELSARLLMERTGQDLAAWNLRVRELAFPDEKTLRGWLRQHGVIGYAQSLLVMEQFGYPDFYTASADELIDGQYADRSHLRPIFDAILAAAASLGPLTIQARKTYVSLVTTRRTFARIQPTTLQRIDLALRLDHALPAGRLGPSRVHESMKVQLTITSIADLDDEALAYLQKAYEENS